MKNLFPIFFLALLIMSTSCNKVNSVKREIKQSINAVIGDVSFTEKFGVRPNVYDDENLRITTHLTYVEKLLRNSTNSALSKDQVTKRENTLKLLNEYTRNKQFPKNFEFPDQRIPCFIDNEGNICAVGYLIEKTAGRELAEQINEKFKYEYVLAMNDLNIEKWALNNGLTVEECAMIQPAYGGVSQETAVRNEGVTSSYSNATIFTSAFNFSVTTLNAIQLSKKTESKYLPIVGLASGVGQLILGIANYPTSTQVSGVKYVNSDRLNHSLLNIGLGASTMILSGLNLAQHKTVKQKSFNWALQSMPIGKNEMALGVGMSLKL